MFNYMLSLVISLVLRCHSLVCGVTSLTRQMTSPAQAGCSVPDILVIFTWLLSGRLLLFELYYFYWDVCEQWVCYVQNKTHKVSQREIFLQIFFSVHIKKYNKSLITLLTLHKENLNKIKTSVFMETSQMTGWERNIWHYYTQVS